MHPPALRPHLPLLEPLPEPDALLQEHPDALTLRHWAQGQVPEATSERLRPWFQQVLLGYAWGLSERHMRREDLRHVEPIPRILEDVAGLFEQLEGHPELQEAPDLLAQVFDFGVQWAYYLDWKLYLSQELY